MKKTVLLSAMLAVGAMCANATDFYTTENLGEVYGVSDNGRYAVVADIESNVSYLWDQENPTEFKLLDGNYLKSEAYDASDNGTVVGSVYVTGGKWNPAYTDEKGDWQLLPVDATFYNTGYATNINADGTKIAGYQFVSDATAEKGGRYFPCMWTLESGKWVLTMYNNIKLPNHQGFITTSMLERNGKTIIGGYVFTNWGGVTNCLLVDGEFKVWNKMEERMEPFMFRGKYEAYDENGNQIWVDDVNDPRVKMYPNAYIDGFREGNGGTEDMFMGQFIDCDWDGNFFGCRTQVRNVDEEGNGTLLNGACIYNIDEDKFTDFNKETGNYVLAFGTGFGDKYNFLNGDNVMVDGKIESISSKWGFSFPKTVNNVARRSRDGKVLAGCMYQVNPASGEPQFYPFVVVLDEPLVKIESAIENVGEDLSEVAIYVVPGMIRVEGAEQVAVYDINGRMVGNSSLTSVAPGVYVVKAGQLTRKVIVK